MSDFSRKSARAVTDPCVGNLADQAADLSWRGSSYQGGNFLSSTEHAINPGDVPGSVLVAVVGRRHRETQPIARSPRRASWSRINRSPTGLGVSQSLLMCLGGKRASVHVPREKPRNHEYATSTCVPQVLCRRSWRSNATDARQKLGPSSASRFQPNQRVRVASTVHGVCTTGRGQIIWETLEGRWQRGVRKRRESWMPEEPVRTFIRLTARNNPSGH